jgi:hypothetical protein
VYGVLTELPAVYVLYDSAHWSAAFLLALFAVSVWNGGGFYIEVFGRKFERELDALRKELADATARSGRSSPEGSDEPVSPIFAATTGRPFSPKMPTIDLTLGARLPSCQRGAAADRGFAGESANAMTNGDLGDKAKRE